MSKKIQKVLTILPFFFFFCSLAYAAAPVIFYSDLTSGPNTGGQDNKGIFVTIGGKNFGTIRGSSYVTVGGGEVDNYPVWSDTEICFQLGANADTGNIVVTTAEGSSNGIAFTIRSGNIYFVDDTSPNDPGSGTYSDPWRSPQSYCLVIEGGEDGAICYFRAGTYTGRYTASDWQANFTLDASHSGTSGNENAFIGYPNEIANFVATESDTTEHNFRGKDTSLVTYMVISNLNLEAENSNILFFSDGCRVVNNYCVGLSELTASGMITCKGNNIYIYGNELTGGSSGNKLDHAFYPNEGENLDFGWNYIHNNNFDTGPIISIHHDNAWVNNWDFVNYHIHDNIIDVSSYPCRVFGVYETGENSTIYYYNNIIIGHSPNANATIYAISGNLYYYNNTIYSGGYTNTSVFNFYAATEHGHDYHPISIDMKNNIVYADSNAVNYLSVQNDVDVPLPTLDNNCWYGIGTFSDNYSGKAGITNNNAVESNPNFTDIENGDYSISDNSLCKDSGYDTSTIVARDYNGVARPQNSVVDIGAYEYVSSTPDTTAPDAVSDLSAATGDNDGEVDLTWTASGDDGGSGTATTYVIKYSTSDITNDSEFNAATDVTGEPSPSAAGSSESMTVTGLTGGTTHYFAMKAQDEVPNTSALSNSSSAAAGIYYSPVVTDIPNQAIQEGGSFSTITLDNYVSDADNQDSEITWTYLGNSDLTVSITNRVATITTPNINWTGIETITFTATDPRGESDSDAATFTATAVNDAPVVSDISNQTINEGSSFTTISLDSYVADVDHSDSQITWTYSGNSELTVSITDRVATISIPSSSWTGAETITFIATDPAAASDSDSAVFTVNAVNDTPVVTDIPNQTVAEGASFSTISLDSYVSDADHTDTQMTWTYSGNSELTISITNRVATISTPSSSWSGAETITFTATDPGGESDSDSAVFTVESTPPYVEEFNPEEDEVQVPTDTNIIFHVKDDAAGVDQDTIQMTIQREGDALATTIIENGQNALSGHANAVDIDGTASDYTIVYDPPNSKQYRLSNEEAITVTINASDLAGTAMSEYSYSFTSAMMLRGPNIKVNR